LETSFLAHDFFASSRYTDRGQNKASQDKSGLTANVLFSQRTESFFRMHTMLLHTKWQTPTLTYPLTPRVRLLHRLTQGIENRLTLLSAPAGYGKTTLLAQWIPMLSPADWHIACLSLDERDNDL
jgi:hypothetical protein